MTDFNPKNKFYLWAPGNNPNMMSDEDYAESMEAGKRFYNGVFRGVAESKQMNKTLRQSTMLSTALIEKFLEIFPKYKDDITDTMDPKTLGGLLFAALRYASNDMRSLTEDEINYTEKGYEKGYITYADNQLIVSIADDNFDEPSISSKKWLPLDDGYIKSKARDKEHHIIYEMAMKDDSTGMVADAIIHDAGGEDQHVILPSDDWVNKTLEDYVKSARVEPKLDKVYDIAIREEEDGQCGDAIINAESGSSGDSVLLAGVNWVKKKLLDYIKSKDEGDNIHKIYKFTIKDDDKGQCGDAVIKGNSGDDEDVILAGTNWVEKNLEDYVQSLPADSDENKIYNFVIKSDEQGKLGGAITTKPNANDDDSVNLTSVEWVKENLTHYVKSDELDASHHKVYSVTIRDDEGGEIGEFMIQEGGSTDKAIDLAGTDWVETKLLGYIQSPDDEDDLHKVEKFSIKDDEAGKLGEATLKNGDKVDLTSPEWVQTALIPYIQSPDDDGDLHKIEKFSIRDDEKGKIGEATLKNSGSVDLTSVDWVENALEHYIKSPGEGDNLHKILAFSVFEEGDDKFGRAQLRNDNFDLAGTDWVKTVLEGYIKSDDTQSTDLHQITNFTIKDDDAGKLGEAVTKDNDTIDLVSIEWVQEQFKKFREELDKMKDTIVFHSHPSRRRLTSCRKIGHDGSYLQFDEPYPHDGVSAAIVTAEGIAGLNIYASIKSGTLGGLGCGVGLGSRHKGKFGPFPNDTTINVIAIGDL